MRMCARVPFSAATLEDVRKGAFFGCHPCENTSSLRLSTDDLLQKILPALGHEPTFVTLPDAAAPQG